MILPSKLGSTKPVADDWRRMEGVGDQEPKSEDASSNRSKASLLDVICNVVALLNPSSLEFLFI